MKTLFFGFMLANQVGAVVTAALGREDWFWWPLVALLGIPVSIALVWPNALASLFNRPVFVVDSTGVALGRKRLTWEEIKAVEPPRALRNRSSDPRKPVDESREWFALVTIAPTTHRRKRQILVGTNHVKDLEALTTWLQTIHKAHQPNNQAT